MSYHGFGLVPNVANVLAPMAQQQPSPFVYAQLGPVNLQTDTIEQDTGLPPPSGGGSWGSNQPLLLQVGTITQPISAPPTFNIRVGMSNVGAAVGSTGIIGIPGGSIPGGGGVGGTGQCPSGTISQVGSDGVSYCCPEGTTVDVASQQCIGRGAAGNCPTGTSKVMDPTSGQMGCCPPGTVPDFATRTCVQSGAAGGSSAMLIGLAALAALLLLK